MKRLLGNLPAIAAGAVIGVALCEVLVRVFVPDPRFTMENRIGMWAPDSLAGYRNKAGFHTHAQFFVPVDTNSLGFRGREVAVAKPSGTFRIVGVGDSVTWGVGLRDEDTFLRVLERTLNDGSNHASSFEAINAGVAGYSTYQELQTLRRDGLRLSPDVVLVGFVHNDFYPSEDPFHNVQALHQPQRQDVGEREYAPAPAGPRLAMLDFARAEAMLLRERWRRDRLRVPEYAGDVLAMEPSSEFEKGALAVMEEQFREFKRLADLHRFRLTVLIFPIYPAAKSLSSSPFPQNWLRAFLASEGIDYIDLFDPLRRHPDDVFLDWRHFTPEGNRVIADEVLRHLKEKRWLPAQGG